jgi:hypothetical protein
MAMSAMIAAGVLAGSAVGVSAQSGGSTVEGAIAYPEGCDFDQGDDGATVMNCPDVTVDASDPRLSGTAEVARYGVSGMVGDDMHVDLHTEVVHLENDGGAWSGRGLHRVVVEQDAETPIFGGLIWLLRGEDGYEGLTAYLEGEAEFGPFTGVIVEGVLAEVPEPYPAE